MTQITKQEREELRQACVETQHQKPEGSPWWVATGTMLGLLDALDEAELAEEWEEDYHKMAQYHLEVVKSLAVTERQLSEERKARARDNAAMLKVGPAECG